MRGPYRVTSQQFKHMYQKLLLQALNWYHIYDNSDVTKIEDFAKIFDVARTAAGLNNWREGLQDCLDDVPGSLYSCRAGLQGAGLITRVVWRCSHDKTKIEHRDCLTPFGAQVLQLLQHWEECAAEEANGSATFPDASRGVYTAL